MHLTKRDDTVPPEAVVILVMLGALAVVFLGYAVHRLWGFREDGNGHKPRSVEQEQYMADVRMRNVDILAREVRGSRYGHKTRVDTEETIL